jgi:predicted dehydrogenase
MEVYGQTGYVLAPRRDLLRVRKPGSNETDVQPPPLLGPQADPLSYLAAVVRGDLQPQGLSSLAVNLIVTEILDAARESARTGRRVKLKGG